MRKILIVGATSAIAEATARRFAARSDALFLAARDATRLASIAADLGVRGAARVATATFDATDFDAHAALVERAEGELGGLDVVLIAHGTLSDQAACQHDVTAMRREFDINALSTMSLLTLLADRFEARRQGTLAVISSVAGDRGRQSNYVYGSAKAAVTAFLGGLRQRLAKANVQVLTIKPGFVDTPMTAAIANKGALWAKPEAIATGIERAIDKRRNVVYLPWFWQGIMLVIRHIPEFLFKKLTL